MKNLAVISALVVLLAAGMPALATWSDFSNSFDGETEGVTIGTSNPAWTDLIFLGDNYGINVVSAPGGGRALGAAELGINRQSSTTFSDVDIDKVYDFSIRVRIANAVQDSDAFVNINKGPQNINGDLVFGMGVSDGHLQIVRWGATAADPMLFLLDKPATPNTWYDMRISYTVRRGVPDSFRGYFKESTASQWTATNSALAQVDLSETNSNYIIARARAIDALDNYIDDLSGTQTTQVPELPRAGNFGKRWVRTHPFTIMGAARGQVPAFNATQYAGAGLTTVFSNGVTEPAVVGSAAGLPWHQHINFPRPMTEFTAGMKNTIITYARTYGGTGLMLPDEPSTSEFASLGQMSAWLKETFPDMIVYANALPKAAVADYNAYLDGIINTVKPDALMFDHYPFEMGGTTTVNAWFDNLMTVRNKAIGANMPYWAWLQCWDGSSAYRMPSESDMRWNAFSLLTAGYTGLSYFVYDTDGSSGFGMIDGDGNPRAQYTSAAGLNPEITRIGQALRFVDSKDVRFLPGSVSATPTGLTNWSAGAGADTHIVSAGVDLANPANQGAGKDGIIGFFTDESGQQYFMVTNLYHNANLNASQSSLGFTVQFDVTVDQLLRLNRLTGATEIVNLTGHKLSLTLPGGTGDLFKYISGSFSISASPQWLADSPGDWNAPMNWLGTVPNAPDAVANFLTMITAGRTVYTDSAVTVGTLRFNNPKTYHLAGSGSLTLQTTSGDALIEVLAGNHKINLPLTMANNTKVSLAEGSSLTIADPWNLAAGITVQKVGAGTLNVISTVNIAGAGAKLVVSTGTANLTGTASPELSVVADAAVNFGSRQSLAALHIGRAGEAAMPAGSGVLAVGSLTIAPGGRLDLRDGNMAIEHGGASLLEDVRQLIQSACDGGSWRGSGIASSSAGGRMALGFGLASVLGVDAFAGRSLDSTAVLIKFTYAGDSNLDGHVDIIDLSALAGAWQTNGTWTGGDFDYSGFVDVLDLGLLAANWQAGVGNPLGPQSLTEALAAYGLPVVSVPEPAAVALLCLSAVFNTRIAFGRRRPKACWLSGEQRT